MKPRKGITLVLLALLPGCTPPAPTSSPATRPTATSTPRGHFHLKLILTHSIVKLDALPGSPIVPLKTYPPVTIAEADLYVLEGPTTEAIATLPGNHHLLLQFKDLQLTPDRAKAEQFLFDANFQVATAVGESSCWPFASIAPPTSFLKDKPLREPFGSSGEVLEHAVLQAQEELEITYLGLTTAAELMSKEPRHTLAPLPSTFKAQAHKDLAHYANASTRPAH